MHFFKNSGTASNPRQLHMISLMTYDFAYFHMSHLRSCGRSSVARTSLVLGPMVVHHQIQWGMPIRRVPLILDKWNRAPFKSCFLHLGSPKQIIWEKETAAANVSRDANPPLNRLEPAILHQEGCRLSHVYASALGETRQCASPVPSCLSEDCSNFSASRDRA